MPQRIQLRRTKGWRKPEGAIIVSRPSRWGNPFKVGMVVNRVALHPLRAAAPVIIEITVTSAAAAVDYYRQWLDGRHLLVGGHDLAPAPPAVDELRAELRGHDLACWCPLVDEHGQRVPCHADVLLELANGADLAGETVA